MDKPIIIVPLDVIQPLIFCCLVTNYFSLWSSHLIDDTLLYYFVNNHTTRLQFYCEYKLFFRFFHCWFIQSFFIFAEFHVPVSQWGKLFMNFILNSLVEGVWFSIFWVYWQDIIGRFSFSYIFSITKHCRKHLMILQENS